MSPFLIVLCPARNKYRTRKGIQFWVESLIINSAEELCFWRSQFQYYLGSFYIFWILTLYQIHDSQIFLPFSRLSFHFVDAFLWCAETLFLFLFPLPEETYPKKYCQDWCQKVYCRFSSFFCIFFFWPWSLWDSGFPTRDWTQVPYSGCTEPTTLGSPNVLCTACFLQRILRFAILHSRL